MLLESEAVLEFSARSVGLGSELLQGLKLFEIMKLNRRWIEDCAKLKD